MAGLSMWGRTIEPAPRALLARRLAMVRACLGRRPRERAPVVTAPVLALGGIGLLAACLLFFLDERIALAMRQEPEGVRAVLDHVTDVALIKWYFYPSLALAAALFLLRVEPDRPATGPGRHRLGVHCATLAASLGLATTITHALKYGLGRARPIHLDELGAFDFAFLRLGSTFESFPSGHSNNAGVLAIVLAVWFPALRWPLLVLGCCLAMTRIAVEAHFASDVAAGLAIGAVTALCVTRWLARRRIVYRMVDGGAGWRGLLPYRPVRCSASAAKPRRRSS